jgi:hypothetical protein
VKDTWPWSYLWDCWDLQLVIRMFQDNMDTTCWPISHISYFSLLHLSFGERNNFNYVFSWQY